MRILNRDSCNPHSIMKRIAAYARVSTDYEEQESSYETQMAHFRNLIESHEGWVLAGIYADEGISATTTAKRESFNRMLRDCESGLIDMVITKSISRWARNTLDSLKTIRRLKELGIPVLFEKENINTLDTSGELLLTILSSLAQQESKSISDNVKLGICYHFQQGKPMLNHSQFLGYTKDKKGGELIIVPEEAEIVRRIFRNFIEGMTIGEIVEMLENEGVPSPAGNEKWYYSTILSMLQNVKYMGDLHLQKTYTVDFLEKKREKNSGVLPQYYVRNAHPPIVPREVFMIARGRLLQREKERLETGMKTVSTKHIVLNGKVFCGKCGATYRRDQARVRKTYWRCRTRLRKGVSCEGRNVKETELKAAVVEAINRLPECLDELKILRNVDWKKRQRSSETRDVQEEYFTKRSLQVIKEVQVESAIELARALQGHLPGKGGPYEASCSDIGEFYERTRSVLPDGPIEEFEDDLVRRFIKRVTVLEDGFLVEFKAGVSIRIPVNTKT